jgi:hypothetical protein
LEEGRGAVSRLSRLTGMSRPTILKGVAELESQHLPTRAESARIRTKGGGRKARRRHPTRTSSACWRAWSKPAPQVIR